MSLQKPRIEEAPVTTLRRFVSDVGYSVKYLHTRKKKELVNLLRYYYQDVDSSFEQWSQRLEI